MQLIGCYISRIIGKPREFCQIYQTFSYSHGDQTIYQTTNVLLRNGKFSSRWGFDSHRPFVNRALQFLDILFKQGLGYSVINSARSALSIFIIISNQPEEWHFSLRYLKVAFTKIQLHMRSWSSYTAFVKYDYQRFKICFTRNRYFANFTVVRGVMSFFHWY